MSSQTALAKIIKVSTDLALTIAVLLALYQGWLVLA
jgi:hypothetical protein